MPRDAAPADMLRVPWDAVGADDVQEGLRVRVGLEEGGQQDLQLGHHHRDAFSPSNYTDLRVGAVLMHFRFMHLHYKTLSS